MKKLIYVLIIVAIGLLGYKIVLPIYHQNLWSNPSDFATLLVDCQTKTEKKYNNADTQILKKITISASNWMVGEEFIKDFKVNYGKFYKQCIKHHVYTFTPQEYMIQRESKQ